jgi:hypothetical protein
MPYGHNKPAKGSSISSGVRFGRLLVTIRDVSALGGHNKYAKWVCVCDCGTTISTPSLELRRGKQSCGCLLRESCREKQARYAATKRAGRTDAEVLSDRKRALVAWKRRDYAKRPGHYAQQHARIYRARKTPCLFCTELSTGEYCLTCCHFAEWVLGSRGLPSREETNALLSALTLKDRGKYLCLKTEKQAQLLRKRLSRTLQSQISDGIPVLSQSSREE